MDPTLRAFLASWSWRPEVLLVLGLLGSTYVTGWCRLRRLQARSASGGRLAFYLAGLGVLALGLLSPIDTFGAFLFFMHMIQHELFVMVAPPLLLLANPLPVLLWGLPRAARRRLGRLLTRQALTRRLLRTLTHMPVALPLYVLTLWLWHLPAAYQAALRLEVVHDAEHLTFFATALLFWWPIVNPAPRLHGHIAYGLRLVYVLLAALQNTLLAALISLTERVLYPYYEAVPRLWGPDAAQ
ncbi:MAG: membrane protein [Candidatus Tectimicrobiota bacterium]|nr:MAG: membrane protein [Candidatus Tectomicrobia bacterium]